MGRTIMSYEDIERSELDLFPTEKKKKAEKKDSKKKQASTSTHLIIERELLPFHLSDGLIYPSRYFQELYPDNEEMIKKIKPSLSNTLLFTDEITFRNKDDVLVELELPEGIENKVQPGRIDIVLPVDVIKKLHFPDEFSLRLIKDNLVLDDLTLKGKIVMDVMESSDRTYMDHVKSGNRLKKRVMDRIFSFMRLTGGVCSIRNTEILIEPVHEVTCSIDRTYLQVIEGHLGVDVPDKLKAMIKYETSSIPRSIISSIEIFKGNTGPRIWSTSDIGYKILSKYCMDKNEFHKVFEDFIKESWEHYSFDEQLDIKEFLEAHKGFTSDQIQMKDLLENYKVIDNIPLFIAIMLNKHPRRSSIHNDNQAIRNTLFHSMVFDKLDYDILQVILFYFGLYYGYHCIRTNENLEVWIKQQMQLSSKRRRPLKLNLSDWFDNMVYHGIYDTVFGNGVTLKTVIEEPIVPKKYDEKFDGRRLIEITTFKTSDTSHFIIWKRDMLKEYIGAIVSSLKKVHLSDHIEKYIQFRLAMLFDEYGTIEKDVVISFSNNRIEFNVDKKKLLQVLEGVLTKDIAITKEFILELETIHSYICR